MPKPVDVIVEIAEDGETIVVKVNGTEGSECLDLLSFVDNIESFVVEDTICKLKMCKLLGNKALIKNKLIL